MSLVLEETIAQGAGPARISMAKLVSLRVTLCLRPAMVHLPPLCEMMTGGAPHCSLGKACSFGCANAEIENQKHSAARKTWFMSCRIWRAHKVSNVSAAHKLSVT